MCNRRRHKPGFSRNLAVDLALRCESEVLALPRGVDSCSAASRFHPSPLPLPQATSWKREAFIFTFVFCPFFLGVSSLRRWHYSNLTLFGRRMRMANGVCPVRRSENAPSSVRLKRLRESPRLSRKQLGQINRVLSLRVHRPSRRNRSQCLSRPRRLSSSRSCDA